LEPEPGLKQDESGQAKEDVAPAPGSPSTPNHRKRLWLRQEQAPPLFCQSEGRSLAQPLVTHENVAEEYVTWPTDKGYLNVGCVNRQDERSLTLKYRMGTNAPIVARPAYLPPDPKVLGDSGVILAVSRDGFIYAVRESDGSLLWRFATAEPIVEGPAVIDDRVYVATQPGGMYCLDIKSGKSLWWAPNVMRFVAASQARVYVVDRWDRIEVLAASSGARLDTIAAERIPVKFLNTDNDRIFLADSAGVIQCLHEIELREPLEHGKDRKQAADETSAAEQKQAASTEAGEKGGKKAGQAGAKKEAPAPKEPKAKKAGKKAAEAGAADAAPTP
jgi:hypothetical protein